MRDDRSKRDVMFIEQATISTMSEIVALGALFVCF